MRIAFDLDDTLLPSDHSFPTEPRPKGLMGSLFAKEELREGAVELLQSLTRAGHEVWIYTTSYRSRWATTMLFRAHGIEIAGVVNRPLHVRRLASLPEELKTCTKYPPAFEIDLLVDNSEAILEESLRYDFNMLLVHPEDTGWVEKIKRAFDAA